MNQRFKVIIVGGSIAGLSLAHCLDHAGIEYLVLERHHDIAPQVGASVGIMPNGARILDQMGLFGAVETEIEPLEKSHINYPDGFSFTSIFPKILNDEFGYPVAFLDRQKFLAILYEGLKNKETVHLQKKVVRIESLNSEVRVNTADGSCYHADLVVGADGIHSMVRSAMWQDANEKMPTLISKEKKSISVEYACIYGISTAVSGLKIGEQITCFCDHLTILTFNGKAGRVFWFVIKKTDRKYYWPNVPRFSNGEAERLSETLTSRKVYKNVNFGHIWEKRNTYSMTALEENVFNRWHFRRLVCLGDSMHKLTPNLGQGANSAIESAACLTNHLYSIIAVNGTHKPTDTQLDSLLTAFTKRRRKRMRAILKEARFITRLQARDGLLNIIIGRYIAPYAGDLPASMAGKVMHGAEKLEFLPLPQRSRKGWPADLECNIVTVGKQKQSWKARLVSISTSVLMLAGFCLNWAAESLRIVVMQAGRTGLGRFVY